jgi:hypothetical protein
MAEAALYQGWGMVVRGREKAALDLFNESLQYYGRLQKEGKIESFDVAVLNPTGGENGFILLRGSAKQIDALRRDDEYQELLNRVNLIVDGLRVADAFVDEGLAQQITRYQKTIKQFA